VRVFVYLKIKKSIFSFVLSGLVSFESKQKMDLLNSLCSNDLEIGDAAFRLEGVTMDAFDAFLR
jgi:hypothetical protein